GAYEILVGTNAVRNLIRENQVAQIYSMIQTGTRYGMVTMEDSIKGLVQQGIISEETARTALLKVADKEDDTKPAAGAAPAAPAAKPQAPQKPAAAPPEKKSLLGKKAKAPEAAPAPDAGGQDEGYSF